MILCDKYNVCICLVENIIAYNKIAIGHAKSTDRTDPPCVLSNISLYILSPCLLHHHGFLICLHALKDKKNATEKIDFNFNWTLHFSGNDTISQLISWYQNTLHLHNSLFFFIAKYHFHLTTDRRQEYFFYIINKYMLYYAHKNNTAKALCKMLKTCVVAHCTCVDSFCLYWWLHSCLKPFKYLKSERNGNGSI